MSYVLLSAGVCIVITLQFKWRAVTHERTYERLRDLADVEQELLGGVRPTTTIRLRSIQDRRGLAWGVHDWGLGMLVLVLVAHLVLLRG